MDSYIHPSAVIDEGAIIAQGARIWHFCHLMPGAKLGENCSLGQNVFIDNDVVLGRGVKVQNNVSIYSGVVIEDDVFLGPSMVFTNVTNPRSFISRKSEFKKTIIRRGATIGANATIICGTEVGEYAFVGAGAVVSKNVLNYELVTGIPAKHQGWVSKAGIKLRFRSNEYIAVCPLGGDRYMFLEDGVVSMP